MSQSQGIRFLWDFYAPDAQRTADHHHRHLKEFLARHNWSLPTGSYEESEGHFCAYVETLERPLALQDNANAEAEENDADQIGPVACLTVIYKG